MLNEYLTKLASSSPAPGGGAAAALTAAQGVALCGMVLRISQGSAEAISKADILMQEFQDLAAKDAAAFEAVMSAQKLPKDSLTINRAKELDTALKNAALVPLTVMSKIHDAAEFLQRTAEASKSSVLSDVGVGLELLDGALKASVFNVYANLKYIKDTEFNQQARAKISAIQGSFTKAVTPLRLSLVEKFG